MSRKISKKVEQEAWGRLVGALVTLGFSFGDACKKTGELSEELNVLTSLNEIGEDETDTTGLLDGERPGGSGGG